MSFERRGIPTATFLTHAFATYGRGLCRMQGMETLPSIVIPHPIAARPTDDLREKVRRAYQEMRAALVRAD